MRILIINKFLHPNGGSETYIFKVGRQLETMGHAVEYFGMEHEGRIVGNRAESYVGDMDFHTGSLSKVLYPFKILYSVEAKKKLRPVLEEFSPDVIHLNNFNFQLTPSVLYEVRAYERRVGKKIRMIYTAHDSQLVCPNHLMQNPLTLERCTKCMQDGVKNCVKGKCIHGSRLRSILAALEHVIYARLKTYRMLDQIICPSVFLKERLQTDPVLAEKLIVLRNFAEAGAAAQEKGEYVLYFGRYSPEKGICTLLQACRNLPRIPFVFAGRGPFQRQVAEVENIEDRGFLTGQELMDLIAGARFSVFPSECYENCPFSVMESLLCHTPVIGVDAGGVPELIREGVDGELFVCGDAAQLTERIENLWQNRELCAQYTQNCGTAHFDTVEEYCRKLCMIYQGRWGNDCEG